MAHPKRKPSKRSKAKTAPSSIADQQARFIEALSGCGNVSKACVLSRVPRRTMYNWRRDNEQFAKLWEEAAELGTDALEDEANRRAFEGVDRPVFQGKQLVGHVRDYSDTLLIFLLKARRPNKYRDRLSAEVTGVNGGAVQHEHKHRLTSEQFDALPVAEQIRVMQEETRSLSGG